ncbi:NAD-dependent epimerase/dehydratase family protein [Enterococcus dispar]|uniref:NAD-dependent epimerase/dehydratase family protein n=1 Tax=Enterococcus dispar TaxID=44009 RepID=UPI00189E5CA6|nr:NAD-dependent epimerase/dehydratase family protein [Enterococcus dispar]
MKRILIGGANSYIGTSFERFMNNFSDKYIIDTVDMRNDDWMDLDFSIYDCIIQIAAIVHVKETNKALYFKVNRDLAVNVAKKAKDEGVRQFIYFSSMSVFGKNEGTISKNTVPNPIEAYGISKLEAESILRELNSEAFNVVIIRPPMIYGKNSIGNYARLSKIAQKTLFFPNIANKRSMLYIDNLSAFCKLLIDNDLSGIFHPQNEEFVNTSTLVRKISKAHGKSVKIISGTSWLISSFKKKSGILKKVFGTLVYDDSTIGYPGSVYQGVRLDYQYRNFDESIRETEL